MMVQLGLIINRPADRDICIALGGKDRWTSEVFVEEVASGEVVSCKMDDDFHHALHLMREKGVRRLPVLDGNGELQGVLCLDDIVMLASCCDGAKRPDVSYEDVVNTFRGIRLHRGHEVKHRSDALAISGR